MSSHGDSWRSRGRGSYSRGSSMYGRRWGRGGQSQEHTMRQSDPQFVNEVLPPPVGPVLLEISGKNIAVPLHEGETCISKVKYATSYNWLETENPTIQIPGKPPAWTPLTEPVQLSQDSGVYYRDQNAARYPDYPMDPSMRALFQVQPKFPGKDIDIVACGSTLGNLLRFVRRIDKPFRLLLEAIGDTVFFIRKEASPRQTIPKVYGYGHTFPEAYTTWESDVKGSESHQRLIQYRFGGLSFLLRFESDGYLPGKAATAVNPFDLKDPVAVDDDESKTDVDHLLDALQMTTMRPKAQNLGGDLTVTTGGKANIPQNALFDLKTRSAKKKDVDTLAEEVPRLWIAQIPNFILAYHESGTFKDIMVVDALPQILKWEKDNQEIVEQFAVLLHELVDFARGKRDRTFEVRCSEVGKLELREFTPEQSSAALSPEMRALWRKSQGFDDESLSDDDFDEDNDGDDESDEGVWRVVKTGGVCVSDD